MFTHQSAVCLGEHKIPPASDYDIRYDDLSLCFHSLLLQNSVSKRALCYCGRVSFVARSVFLWIYCIYNDKSSAAAAATGNTARWSFAQAFD